MVIRFWNGKSSPWVCAVENGDHVDLGYCSQFDREASPSASTLGSGFLVGEAMLVMKMMML